MGGQRKRDGQVDHRFYCGQPAVSYLATRRTSCTGREEPHEFRVPMAGRMAEMRRQLPDAAPTGLAIERKVG